VDPRPVQLDDYRSRVRTCWAIWFAWPRTAVPAWNRIWVRVKFEVSAAKSRSRMVDSDAARFSVATSRDDVLESMVIFWKAPRKARVSETWLMTLSTMRSAFSGFDRRSLDPPETRLERKPPMVTVLPACPGMVRVCVPRFEESMLRMPMRSRSEAASDVLSWKLRPLLRILKVRFEPAVTASFKVMSPVKKLERTRSSFPLAETEAPWMLAAASRPPSLFTPLVEVTVVAPKSMEPVTTSSEMV